jgi:hypothetical protein
MTPALPKKYPGCWKRKGYRRRYQTAWQKIRRQDPEYHDRQLAHQRRYRDTKRGKKANARGASRWRLAHPRRVKAGNRRWHRLHRQRRCHFCGKKGKSGRGALQRIVRMLPDLDGRLVRREVDYCGSC